MADGDGGFQEFVDVRYGELLRIAYLLAGSAHDAEDLVQSALLKVMRRGRKIEDPVACLRRTMANQHLSGWRRVRSREVIGAEPPEPRDARSTPGSPLRDLVGQWMPDDPTNPTALVPIRLGGSDSVFVVVPDGASGA